MDNNKETKPFRIDGSPILPFLYERGIFSVKSFGDTFEITEACDEYFTVRLSQKELIQIGCELIELAIQSTKP